MHVIHVRNVHQALPEACFTLNCHGVQRESRNGRVIVLPMPLTTLYERPRERVLFHPERDANPFFHFFESLWMLAGRNDVAYVEQYAKNMRSFSDDGETLNGAYGHRWRKFFVKDQLKVISRALKKNPADRRQVLTMWSSCADLGSDSKDVPCNTQAYFQRGPAGELNLMVCNRSNDLIWGAYGANAVHFSVLLEYMARLIGCEVGGYWQVSMNTHVYEQHHDLMTKMSDKAPMPPTHPRCPYSRDEVEPLPLMSIQAGRWGRELDLWFKRGVEGHYDDPTFAQVATPMQIAWLSHRRRDYSTARVVVAEIAASDWRRACSEWLQRREASWTNKNA